MVNSLAPNWLDLIFHPSPWDPELYATRKGGVRTGKLDTLILFFQAQADPLLYVFSIYGMF
jgi:hypothetical protein